MDNGELKLAEEYRETPKGFYSSYIINGPDGFERTSLGDYNNDAYNVYGNEYYVRFDTGEEYYRDIEKRFSNYDPLKSLED